MLVLSRKTNEQIRIDDQITISILSVKGSVVRLGIEAPNHVRIVRGELPPLDKHRSNVEPSGDSSSGNSTEVGPSPHGVDQEACDGMSACRQDESLSKPIRPGSLRARLQRRMLAMACQA